MWNSSRSKKFLVTLAIFSMVALTAQGNFGPYLGYLVEGQYCFADGVTLHYTDQGVGEPVILLHGFAMNTDITWRDQGALDYLAGQFRVIGMDMRGHGLSAKPYSPGSYGVEMAKDVARLMDCLGIEKAHIVGNSMGGIVAIKFATLYPDRTQTLTACGFGWARYTDEREEVVNALAKSIEDGDGFGPLIRYLRPADQPIGWMELSAVNALVSYINDPQALLAMTRQIPELEVAEADLRALSMPVLNVIAASDPLLPDVNAMAAVVPNQRTVVVENADHFNLTGTDACREAIAAFLSGASTLEAQPSMS